MHEGNLLTLLPPYFSLMSKNHRKMDVLPFGVWARQLYLWLCIACVSHGNVKCNKPHKVDHNCKNAVCFPAYSLFGETVLAQYLRKSLIWQIQGCKAQRCGYWRILFFFYLFSLWLSFFSPFLWSWCHSLYEDDRLNWLRRAKAGRQAEGWNIKLVNHFLFSLRTAVDWWERPLCPPSQPACKFAASLFQKTTARRGGWRRNMAVMVEMRACWPVPLNTLRNKTDACK